MMVVPMWAPSKVAIVIIVYVKLFDAKSFEKIVSDIHLLCEARTSVFLLESYKVTS